MALPPVLRGMKRSSMLKRIIAAIGAWALGLLQKPWIARLIEAVPFLHSWVNALVINRIVGQGRSRPYPFSTMTPYTSWSSLTDRTWSGRHLGVSKIDQDSLPDPEALKTLFARPDGTQRLCPKSTCLFPTFAQYLTDGFLRTVSEKDPETGVMDPDNRKHNTSNHEIDMCTLYGRTPQQTLLLREKDPQPERRGFLRRQVVEGEDYPPALFKDGHIDPDFEGLDPPLGLDNIVKACADDDPKVAAAARQVRDAVFAVGGDRVNSVPQVSMMNTLWLREHNRLARELGARNPDWDDDRVFETARNIVIVQFIKIVVEDYINHIAPFAVSLKADPKVAWGAQWNKPNWITTEFSLLYRWHSLIPDTIVWGGDALPVGPSYFLNNLPLLSVGLKRGLEDMSAQTAAGIGPRNTTEHLLDIEKDSIRQGRICALETYNAYLEYLGRDRAKTFEDISTDADLARRLSEAYDGDVERVDFFVGIFCEDRVKNAPLPRTILTMVAMDAFSQALTNPLLSEHVFTPPEGEGAEHPTFTRYGWEQIAACNTLRDVVARNVTEPQTLGFIGMTQQDWQPE